MLEDKAIIAAVHGITEDGMEAEKAPTVLVVAVVHQM